MTYEFLKNFHKRSEIVAIATFLTERVSRKQKLKEYHLDGSEAVNLVMLVLLFVMEKSLVEETCTKQDLAGFIRRMDAEYLHKNLQDEEYQDITDCLVKECLQNAGVPYYFITYNFESQKEEKIHVKLIDDKRVSLGTDFVYSYYMTPQGYKFLFNTLEIEEAMQISIEQFKLSLSIKKRNFTDARNSVDNLFHLSKTQIQKINYFIKKVKEDIGNAGIDEYEKIYNSTFDTLEEQKSGYDSLYELIANVEQSMEESGSSESLKAVEQERENLFYIKGRLKIIIAEQSRLLLKQQELQKIYNEAVDELLYIGFENRMNFEETVVNRLEEDITLSEPLVQVLRPLFKPSVNQYFNLQKALKEQKLQSKEALSEGSGILMSEKYFNKQESEEDRNVRERNEKYLDIFEMICKYTAAAAGKELMLSELLKSVGAEYEKLVPEIRILTNVLLNLSSQKEIDFAQMKQQKNSTLFNPSEEFDVKYCVLSLIDRDSAYKNMKKLSIQVFPKEQIFIPERMMEEGAAMEITMGLHCPNLLFKMEVEDFE